MDNDKIAELKELHENVGEKHVAFSDALGAAKSAYPVGGTPEHIEKVFRPIADASDTLLGSVTRQRFTLITGLQDLLAQAASDLEDGLSSDEERKIRERLSELRGQRKIVLDPLEDRLVIPNELPSMIDPAKPRDTARLSPFPLIMLIFAGKELVASVDKGISALEGLQAEPIGVEVTLSRELGELKRSLRFIASGSAATIEGGAAISTHGVAGAAPLQRTFNTAMQTALGRLPRQGDSKSFLAALNRSFTLSDIDGREVTEWTPKSFIGVADLGGGGGITGAQASMVSFARSASDNVLPLLDGLTPLDENADDERVDAARSILRLTWLEFIEELGSEGGPRATRANLLINSILGPSPDQIGQTVDIVDAGHLARLGVELGMVETTKDAISNKTHVVMNGATKRPMIDGDYVVTPEEELNLTSFIAVSDYMYAVRGSWENYLGNFFQKDLGTGLVLLSRALSVVADTVENEVYPAMDALNIGEAERMTVRVDLDPSAQAQLGTEDMTIQELLSWVLSFSSSEAPDMIREGGKLGVRAILPTLELLNTSVQLFINDINTRPQAQPGSLKPSLPQGLSHPLVLDALDELRCALEEALSKAEAIA